MEDYKNDIIIVYHIPVDGQTRQYSNELLNNMRQKFTTNKFFREYFFPKTNSGGKIDIEIINLKANKTENIQIKIEQLDDKFMKYFEHEKWLRKEKLKKIVK